MMSDSIGVPAQKKTLATNRLHSPATFSQTFDTLSVVGSQPKLAELTLNDNSVCLGLLSYCDLMNEIVFQALYKKTWRQVFNLHMIPLTAN